MSDRRNRLSKSKPSAASKSQPIAKGRKSKRPKSFKRIGVKKKPREYGPHLVLRGRRWHIRGTYLGIYLRESTWQTDFSLAQVVLADRLEQIKAGWQGNGKPLKATYGEAHEGWVKASKPTAANLADANKWLKLIGENRLCEKVTWPLVAGIADSILRTGYEQSTLKRTVSIPKSVLNWAAINLTRDRACFPPIFPSLPNNEPREAWLKPEHAEAMFKMAMERGRTDHRYRLAGNILGIGVGEGPRRGDFHNLEWDCVDTERGIIEFRAVKSGNRTVRNRTISDPRPRTIEILRSIRAEAGGIVGPVFRQPNGEPYARAGTLGAAVNPILKELAKECGHKDWAKVTLHTLRHTAATWHLLLTGKMDDVVRRFDWDEKKSAKRYVKNAPYQLAPEAAAFLGLTPKEPRQVWG